MENNDHHEEVKTCPFSGQKCIGEECALWTVVKLTKPGGMIPHDQGMCVFLATMLVAGTPKMMPMTQGGLPIGKLM